MIDIKHLGDITKISGYSAPIVDCVIGGSPCQDLSVAGKRAGLDGERSGLYIEQVRIVKEMRERDEHNGRTGVDVRPRYMVWENVPGAFSSNKGEDFRIVLEELAKVKDKDAVIPMPDKGKWTTSGCIMGDGWSIAWRVLDAQFWGVPQRRRRIALVADFGGQSAAEILFVRQSVSGNTDESKPQRKETASDASGGIGADDCIGVDVFNGNLTQDKVISLVATGNNSTGYSPKVMTPIGADQYNAVLLGDKVSTLGVNCGMSHGRQCILEPAPYTLKIRSGCEGGGKGALVQEDKSATLATNNDQYLFQPVYSVENHPNDSRVGINEDGMVQALTGRMGTGGGKVPLVLALDGASYNQGQNAQYDFEISDKGINSPLVAKGPGAVCYSIDQGGGKSSVDVREDKAPTLTTTHDGAPAVCYTIDEKCANTYVWEEQANTLAARDYKQPQAVCYSFDPGASRDVGTLFIEECGKTLTNGTCPGHHDGVVIKLPTHYIVRRLTPLECERLQGYPDGWTDIGEWTDTKGKRGKTSDAARYKALGNSIALPPWKWVLKRLCACYERDATMASLFDGIGGFPYLWEQLNGKGSCLWASEIEEFPMAVTKARIG